MKKLLQHPDILLVFDKKPDMSQMRTSYET